MGVAVGEPEILPVQVLAINRGQVYGMIDGERTRDPALVWTQCGFGKISVSKRRLWAIPWSILPLCSPLILVNRSPTMRHS